MTDKTLTDPHNVPVTFVNQVAGVGFLNGNINITLATARFTPSGDEVLPDLVVSSRLRMDLYCAQQLYTLLGKYITETTTEAKAVN